MRTLTAFLVPLLCLNCFLSTGRAQVEEEALSFLVSHSDSVVVATFTESGFVIGEGLWETPGSFDVVKVLSGEPKPQHLKVMLYWSRRAGSEFPLKPGQTVVLFLKHQDAALPWKLTDRWLGLQGYSQSLEAAVARISPAQQ